MVIIVGIRVIHAEMSGQSPQSYASKREREQERELKTIKSQCKAHQAKESQMPSLPVPFTSARATHDAIYHKSLLILYTLYLFSFIKQMSALHATWSAFIGTLSTSPLYSLRLWLHSC